MSEGRHIQFFRISREAFQFILSKIESHRVFVNSGTGPNQAPAAVQLGVAKKVYCCEIAWLVWGKSRCHTITPHNPYQMFVVLKPSSLGQNLLDSGNKLEHYQPICIKLQT